MVGLRLRLSTDDLVWYVAYGSNLRAARFGCYLAGGRPRGARRTYVGCRDRSQPRCDVGVRLPGGLRFAGTSRVWGGGIAFYDPGAEGELAARAYQVSFGQFSDVVSQEARRPVGVDLELEGGRDRRRPAPSGIYETVLHANDLDGLPMLTITSLQDLAPHGAVGAVPPNDPRRARGSVRLEHRGAGGLPAASSRSGPGLDRGRADRPVLRRPHPGELTKAGPGGTDLWSSGWPERHAPARRAISVRRSRCRCGITP